MDIRIAICDDEPKICAMLENMLIDILETRGVYYEIEPFYSGENLCVEIQRQIFDLIFLDIELKKKSGLDVSNYIRNELGDESVQIAYISAKTGYAMDLFEFRPINFLVKPLEYSKVVKVIDKFFTITMQNNQFFEYKKRTDFFKIPMSDILYFESKNRKIHITMLQGEDEFYGSMEDVYSIVKNHQFLYIHKSIIVNYRQIKKISYEQIIMVDGIALLISQSRRSAIKKMCMKIRKERR